MTGMTTKEVGIALVEMRRAARVGGLQGNVGDVGVRRAVVRGVLKWARGRSGCREWQ